MEVFIAYKSRAIDRKKDEDSKGSTKKEDLDKWSRSSFFVKPLLSSFFSCQISYLVRNDAICAGILNVESPDARHL